MSAAFVNCSSEFPRTTDFYNVIKQNTVVLVLTGLAVVLTCLSLGIFVEEIVFLFKSHRQTVRRTRFIILLAIFPIISCTSLLSLLVPTSTLLGEFVSSIYLSVCLYHFVLLTIEYMGGEKRLLVEYGDEPISLRTPPCCCCCFCIPAMPASRKLLKTFKIMVLQMAILRPITLFIAAVLWTDGQVDIIEQGLSFSSPYSYISIINVVSTILALYGLIVIFKSTRGRLTSQSIIIKFIALQLTLVFTQLQRAITDALGQAGIPDCYLTLGSAVRASRIHHLLLVIEMFLLSIMARIAYRRVEDDYLSTKTDDVNESGDRPETKHDGHIAMNHLTTAKCNNQNDGTVLEMSRPLMSSQDSDNKPVTHTYTVKCVGMSNT